MSIALSNAFAGRWCGGVHVTSADRAGIHALAGTTAYLDSHDAMLLFVMAAGGADAAAATLAEYGPGQLDAAIAERRSAGAHDRIVEHWDRQP